MTNIDVIDEIFSDGYSRAMFAIGQAAENFYSNENNLDEAWFWFRYWREPVERANSLFYKPE
jgi:hypothetical protein